MKKQNTAFHAVLYAIAALLLAACALEPFAAAPAAAGRKTGRVLISIAAPGEDAGSRTLLPEWTNITYKLEFTRQGETVPALTQTVTTASAEQDLEPGAAYTLKVTAYKTDPAVPAALGSAAGIKADAEQTVPVTVNLALNKAGTGTLDYAIVLPEGMSLKKGLLALYPLSGGADPVYLDINPANPGSMGIPSGYYRARLSVYGSTGGEVQFAAKTEALHISDSLTTRAFYTLAAGDFSGTDITGDKLYIVENPAQLEDALTSVRGDSGTEFTILVRENISSPPVSLADPEYSGKTITLRGSGGNREISLSSQGSLFTIGLGSVEPALKLRDITLKGRTDNNTVLLLLNKGGLVMESGAVVTGNYGGVYVAAGGNFTMRGNASVHGNTFTFGGGVRVLSGSFAMQDSASVYGNTAERGGGVYVEHGTFTMGDNASVSTNTATYAYGGGVYVEKGSFTMQGNASVSVNTASAGSSQARGGGVYVEEGTFTMEGSALVSGNTASSPSSEANGGGVHAYYGSSFIMRDNASVSGNTASATSSHAYGGGVYVLGGTIGGSFTMQDNVSISGNSVLSSSSSARGGGVYINNQTTLTKTGGVIYGSNETGTDSNGEDIKNTAQTFGAAIYYEASPVKYRETTVRADQNLSTGNNTNWND